MSFMAFMVLKAFLNFMEFMRRISFYLFMAIRGFMMRPSLRGLWPSWEDSLHKETAFVIFVGLMRRGPLRRVP